MSEQKGLDPNLKEDDNSVPGLILDVHDDGIPETVRMPKLDDVEQTRKGVREYALALVENNWYERIQFIATIISIIGEPVYRFGSAQLLGRPADEEIITAMRYAYTSAFGINLIAKFTVYGKKHAKSLEAPIDALSILSVLIEILFPQFGSIISFRVLRLASKVSRIGKFLQQGNPLEDEAMQRLAQVRNWQTIGLLILFSLVYETSDLNSAEVEGFLKEMGLDAGIFGIAYRAQRKTGNIISDVYTKKLEKAMAEVQQMGEDNPELMTLMKTILGFVEKEDHELNEVTRIAKAFGKTLIGMKHLINPIDEDLELDKEGRMKPKDIEEAVVMVTDLRGFTPLTEKIEKMGYNIFSFKQRCYFPYLKMIIRSYGGKILNHTGDGLIVYFTDKVEDGVVIRKKEDDAMKCAKALQHATDYMAEQFADIGLGDKHDPRTWHRTGIGMTCGPIKIGDAFTLVSEELTGENEIENTFIRIGKRIQQKVSAVLGSVFKEDPNSEIKAKIASLVGFGRAINEATRLEGEIKKNTGHDCLIDGRLFARLGEGAHQNYEYLGEVMLKGKEEPVKLYGIRRVSFKGNTIVPEA